MDRSEQPGAQDAQHQALQVLRTQVRDLRSYQLLTVRLSALALAFLAALVPVTNLSGSAEGFERAVGARGSFASFGMFAGMEPHELGVSPADATGLLIFGGWTVTIGAALVILAAGVVLIVMAEAFSPGLALRVAGVAQAVGAAAILVGTNCMPADAAVSVGPAWGVGVVIVGAAACFRAAGAPERIGA